MMLSSCHGLAAGLSIASAYDAEIRRINLLDQRDRVAQCPLPPSGPRPWTFPDRAGRTQMRLPRDPSLDPTGRGRARWVTRWKPALTLAITFDGRLNPTGHTNQP
jgi:putative transposase